MSTINNGTVATLRRRAKELRKEYNADWCRVFERAADDLELHQRFMVDGERVALELIADNRRLRGSLVDVFNAIRQLVGKKSKHWATDQIRRALAATKPIGEGRRILALEVLEGKRRDELEAEVKRILDETYKGAEVYGEKNSTDESDEPGGAGDAGGSPRARAKDGDAAR